MGWYSLTKWEIAILLKMNTFKVFFKNLEHKGRTSFFLSGYSFRQKWFTGNQGKGGDKAVFIFDHQFHSFMSFRYYLASGLIAAHVIKRLLLDKIYPPLEASAD